jgi:hypothetical protein
LASLSPTPGDASECLLFIFFQLFVLSSADSVRTQVIAERLPNPFLRTLLKPKSIFIDRAILRSPDDLLVLAAYG